MSAFGPAKLEPDDYARLLYRRVQFEYFSEDGKTSEMVFGVLDAIAPMNHTVAIKKRGETRLLFMSRIVDRTEEMRPRLPLENREVRHVPRHLIRQHLGDRHAVPKALLEAMDDETAWAFHDAVNHESILHFHKGRDE